MRLSRTFGFGVAAAALTVASPAFALDASTEVSAYTGNLDGGGNLMKTVFEDDIWGHIDTTDASPFGTGDVITSVARIQAVGSGSGTPPLNPPTSITDTTTVAGFAIEAVLKGTIFKSEFVTAAVNGTGSDQVWKFLNDVELKLYFGDNVANDTILGTGVGDTLAGGVGKFADNALAATFEDDGIDDFYVIKFDTSGNFLGFELGLTLVSRDTTQIGDFVDTALAGNSATHFIDGRMVDLYGRGTPETIISGSGAGTTWQKMDGDFTAAIVPTPAAAGLGFLAFGVLGLTRIRREM